MFNEAGHYELSWEAMVGLIGFPADPDGFKGALRDLWGYYGDWCLAKPQMDDGRVLQTRTYRPWFSVYFQYLEDCNIYQLGWKHLLCRSPRLTALEVEPAECFSLHNYPQQQLLSFFLRYILFARGLKMATHRCGYEFAGPSFRSHLCSFAALSSHSEIRGWIQGCWIKAFSPWDRGWWCIIFCLNSAEVTVNANPSFPRVLIPSQMWISISAHVETYSMDAEFPLPKSYI